MIGDPKKLYGVSPQIALAQSSNTAFTDLAHRVTTSKIIQMAQAYGVNISAFKQGGSNLDQMVGQVGLALGTASLTVNEQATMLSTIADNGVYHTAHIVKYWQSPDGPKTPPIMQTRGVLDPTNAANNAALASQVQYAMSMTTVNGTGTAAAVGLGNRPIIAKTGTTTNSHAGFFIGAIPQYSLVVGMFTESQAADSPENLGVLTGGGFGGYWPAKIWNTFAQAEFASLPVQNFENPVFSGNEVGPDRQDPQEDGLHLQDPRQEDHGPAHRQEQEQEVQPGDPDPDADPDADPALQWPQALLRPYAVHEPDGLADLRLPHPVDVADGDADGYDHGDADRHRDRHPDEHGYGSGQRRRPRR